MKKRDLSVVTPKIKKLITIWLEESCYRACPFDTLWYEQRNPEACSIICKKLFPNLDLPNTCPCIQFGTKYVIKVAKELVK